MISDILKRGDIMPKVEKNNIIIPDSVTDFQYLNRVIDKEYGNNKSFEVYKNSVINFFRTCLIKHDPARTNILISWYMLYTKYDRTLLLKALQSTVFNLNISYIHYNDDRVSTSFL